MSARDARVLLIDDDTDAVSPLRLDLEELLRVAVRHPSDVTPMDVRRASLILIDQNLGEWPSRDKLHEIALKPKTGLALASVLRAHVVTDEAHSAIAFGLLSGRLKDLAGGLPQDNREHSIARCNNLEWVFAKRATPKSPDLRRQIVSLARGVRRLPRTWPREDQSAMIVAIGSLMGLRKSEEWSNRAWEDMEKCRPPFHELATATHGLAFVRWMLQRILPYPCFLMSTPYLAARLYVTPQSLEGALAADPKFVARLRATKYSGVFADFAGVRWWRAGVEALLWKLTRRRPFDAGALRTAVQRLSPRLAPIDIVDPVVCVDDDYVATDQLMDIRDAVEVQPDDWPSFADRAWVGVEEARSDPRLSSVVVLRDRERLRQAAQGEA